MPDLVNPSGGDEIDGSGDADSEPIDGEEGVEEEGVYSLPHVVTIQPIRDPEDEPFVFRFELGPAILQQLLVKLESLAQHPLEDAVGAKHPGFYQLFLDGEPVYIGKTSRAINQRIPEHIKKLRGRISLDRITCRFAYVEDPSLVDISEGALIRFFDEIHAAEWNHSGFGSKVTGYGRGSQRMSDWVELYPPDLDWEVTIGSDSEKTLAQLVWQLTREAPIPFSLPNKFRGDFKKDHPEQYNLPEKLMPFSAWVTWVRERLAEGWEIEETDTGWYIVKR